MRVIFHLQRTWVGRLSGRTACGRLITETLPCTLRLRLVTCKQCKQTVYYHRLTKGGDR